jgi:hypothetical protein
MRINQIKINGTRKDLHQNPSQKNHRHQLPKIKIRIKNQKKIRRLGSPHLNRPKRAKIRNPRKIKNLSMHLNQRIRKKIRVKNLNLLEKVEIQKLKGATPALWMIQMSKKVITGQLVIRRSTMVMQFSCPMILVCGAITCLKIYMILITQIAH